MSKLDSGEIRRLKDSSLEHLWIYGREPSEMAEKGGPRVIVSGKGSIVRDSDGREYIDGHAGLAVRNIGYGRPEIADVVYEQMKDLSFMPWGSATIPGMQLAEKLSDITPGDLSRVFFTSGGSEANETAIKLVKSYHHRMGEPTRYRFISRQQSYHGGTFATLSLGGGVSSNEPYEPVMPGVVHVPTPDPYRCPLGGTTPYECSVRCANAVADAIKFYGPRSIAAVIAEPISASNGAAIPGDEYWPMLRDICDTNGVLLIADEVVTGFGRTGKMFACEHWGITPDIMSMGKGFTSGYLPMSGAIARKSIADVFVGSEDVTFRHIFTHGGHPACAAAALENIRIIESENLLTNSVEMGSYLLDGLQELKGKHHIIGDVRAKGLFAGVVFHKDRESRESIDPETNFGTLLNNRLFENGLILARGSNEHLVVCPPLCITRDEVDQLISVMDKTIAEVKQELSLT
jgi:adenosylmethionine-8-amino-7-oxononanoate aminotransferase